MARDTTRLIAQAALAVGLCGAAYFGYREAVAKHTLINERRQRQADIAERALDLFEQRSAAKDADGALHKLKHRMRARRDGGQQAGDEQP